MTFLKFLAFVISIGMMLKGFFEQLTPKNEYERMTWGTKDAIFNRKLKQLFFLVVGLLLFRWSSPAITQIIKVIGSK